MKAYAIKDDVGDIISSSIKFDEDTCKVEFIKKFGFEMGWKGFPEAEKEGWSCVPVEITEIKK